MKENKMGRSLSVEDAEKAADAKKRSRELEVL